MIPDGSDPGSGTFFFMHKLDDRNFRGGEEPYHGSPGARTPAYIEETAFRKGQKSGIDGIHHLDEETEGKYLALMGVAREL